MKKHYDLIIFDCDGTLVDSETINNQAVSEILIENGLPNYTLEYCMEAFTGVSLHNLINEILKELKNISGEQLMDAIITRGNLLASKNLKPAPYAQTLLSEIKHKKCVASNGQRSSVIQSLHITGLFSYFSEDHIFTYEQVPHAKPAPDLFLFAAKEMGAQAADCLVIEDSPTGVKAAKAAGMDVLGFTGISHNNAIIQLQKAKPDAMIGHLSEVLSYLK